MAWMGSCCVLILTECALFDSTDKTHFYVARDEFENQIYSPDEQFSVVIISHYKLLIHILSGFTVHNINIHCNCTGRSHPLVNVAFFHQ